jgi:hypothetical protein
MKNSFKVKAKLALVLNKASRHVERWGSGGILTHFNLGTIMVVCG